MSANAPPARVPTAAARELLVDLVSIPSPSGAEDAAARRLAAFFDGHGREVRIDEVGNVRAPADDSVLLTSHLDTVPGEIPVRIEGDETGDEVLRGRGSVDATGPLAALAVAAVRAGASFVGVVGEETDSRGARHLVADREAPGAVINGEPSGADGIALGYRGLLPGTYVASTDAGHSSRPEPNALQRAIRWWTHVEEAFDDETGDADDEPGDHGDSGSVFERVTAKPVRMDGATGDDGLAVEATVDVQFRVPPSLEVDAVRAVAQRRLEGGSITWGEPIPPVMADARTALARAFRVAIRAAGGQPRLLRKTGTSDMNLYADAWDCPTVTYGPGDSALDHAPDERLSLAEFDRSIAIAERVADSLCGDSS